MFTKSPKKVLTLPNPLYFPFKKYKIKEQAFFSFIIKTFFKSCPTERLTWKAS